MPISCEYSPAETQIGAAHYVAWPCCFTGTWRRSSCLNSCPPHPKGTHALLHVFILAASLVGWLISSARQSSAALLGSYHWPKIASVKELDYSQRVHINDTLMPFHSIVSYAGLCLVALHVSAALYHHFWRGDQILARMLPMKVIPESLKQAGSK